MRKPINVLYYPNSTIDPTTLKRAILLFDEFHITDNPSFSFGGGGKSNFGMVGSDSPLRQVERSFRDEGVPLYVHSAPGGRISEEDYATVCADVNDLEFLRRFQQGLNDSPAFRGSIVPTGNYGPVGNQNDVIEAFLDIDLSTAFSDHGSPMGLSEDPQIQQFRHSTPHERAKAFVNEAIMCATRLNLALAISARYDHQPMADASPFGNLLGAKYARAMAAADQVAPRIPVTDLSFSILDELIPPERLKSMSFPEVIKYRKSSADAREHFLEHVAALQVKAGEIPEDGNYQAEIEKIITTEIVPAARDFRNKVTGINEGFVAHLATGLVTFLGGSSAMQIFAGLPWSALLALAAGAAVVGKGAIDAAAKERATYRESSLSYILSLD